MESLLESLKYQTNQPSTDKNYYGVWRKFNQFIIRLDRLPETWEARVAIYCAYLICEQGLQSSTVRSYISGIKSVLTRDGYEWNDNKILLNVLTKSCKVKNDRLKVRLPIQKGLLEIILCEIRRKYDMQPYLEALYVSAFLLGYYGLMRVGELTESIHTLKAINVHECRNSKKLLLVLYSSKTHNKGDPPQKIRITGVQHLQVQNEQKEVTTNSDETTDRSNDVQPSHFCPVMWTKHFIQLRQEIYDLNEQLFVFADGSPLKAIHMRQLLRSILFQLDLDQFLYDTHSLRIGRATDLFKKNVPVDKIKQLGRWKSNAVYKYLRN